MKRSLHLNDNDDTNTNERKKQRRKKRPSLWLDIPAEEEIIVTRDFSSTIHDFVKKPKDLCVNEYGPSYSAGLRKGWSKRRVECQDTYSTISLSSCLWSLYGVYDGHGNNGRDVAEIASLLIEQCFINDEILNENDMESILYDKFNEINNKCVSMYPNGGGTTATIVIWNMLSKQLYIIHLGDCRCILGGTTTTNNNYNVNILTRDHTTDDEEEYKRVINDGGTIDKAGGRLRVNHKLCVTRSLGDAVYKPYVTHVPEITKYQLDYRHDHFMIIASDGLWNVIDNEKAVRIVNKCHDKTHAAQALIHAARDEYSTSDDICVIVVYF